MEFMPRASWNAKFQWRSKEKISREIHLSAALAPNSQQRNSNYENIYPSYGSGCHAWLEFVRRGACHDHHHSRDYHGSAAGGAAADNNDAHLRLLAATVNSQGARAEWLRALFLLRRSLDFGFRFFRLADDGGDRLQFFAFAQSKELHAHGIAAGLAYVLHRRPHHLTFRCDQH